MAISNPPLYKFFCILQDEVMLSKKAPLDWPDSYATYKYFLLLTYVAIAMLELKYNPGYQMHDNICHAIRM